MSPEKRKKVMQAIKGKDTKIEIRLRKALWHKGYRYRKNYTKLPGSPDIALTKYQIAIFCDSEFFHGKDWEKLHQRLTKGERGEYWVTKISRNMARDLENDHKLENMGWIVLHFWGNDIEKNLDSCIIAVEDAIQERLFDAPYHKYTYI